MNREIANACYGYFEVLYRLNKRIIKLCGMNGFEIEEMETEVLDIVHDFGRLFPYVVNTDTHMLELCCKDGLLEFCNDVSYIEEGYRNILEKHYNSINQIRNIRNKYEHKMHGVQANCSSGGDDGYARISFDIKKKDGNNEIDLNVKTFVDLIRDLNSLFSKLSSQVAAWAEENDTKEYLYYKRVKRIDFEEFNTLYEDVNLKIIGKLFYDF